MRYKINHIAVWILAIAQTALGALWYSPLAFGNEWMGFLGLTETDIDRWNFVPFVVAIAGTVLLTYFLAWLLLHLDVAYLSEAVKVGFLLWLCAVVTEHATHYAFQGVHFGVLLIDMGKTLVGILLSTIVLVSWRKRAS
ncbi:MAG: DUF1761 domain-containing protein [Gammaproteobacteria bacterium]|nr:DUF1761 domain-containing protein [Gammaproteobacteria bacterium]